MTSPADVAIVVKYFSTKATGATLKDAIGSNDKKYFDSRKISAYEFFGILEKDGEKFRLSERGRRMARGSQEDIKREYQTILRENRPYNLALEWAYNKGFSELLSVDVASHWVSHAKNDIAADNERTIRYQVATFMQLVESAGLGLFYTGRKGKETRIEISKDDLGRYIGDQLITEGPEEVEEEVKEIVVEDKDFVDDIPEKKTPLRVFISHGHNMEIVEQIKTMLDLAGLKYEVVVEHESTAIPVPDKVFHAMRNCNSAVICITADDDNLREDGGYEINNNVLIEIGAAFVLFDKKVVLVWDKRISIPSNLQGLYRCEFEGNELTWSAGMKLMKAVNTFKKEE